MSFSASASRWLIAIGLALFGLMLHRPAYACETAVAVCETPADGSLGLIVSGKALPVIVAPDAHPAVRDAARRFAADLGRVGGTEAAFLDSAPDDGRAAIIVGVAGEGGLVDELAAAGKIDLAQVAGRWEAFGQFVVEDPLPGLERALVVAGADKRGAAFGLYDLSEKIGVSPWNWWADVPVARRDALYLTAGARVDAPGVRYRGFFINDEDPALAGWAKERFGGLNAQFYEHVFELLLRLKGNYLWPAMWGKSIAEDDPRSMALAAEMGVVLGTSHHEPLTRAHVEWERAREAGEVAGEWNYATNDAVLRRFWREGMDRAEAVPDLETVVTIGMRGDGDEAMSEETAIPLLEKIVADQRAIIAETTGRPAAETPQVWALYKEVQDYYDQGMRVPDDVTLLFADDNWGQIRRLPNPAAPPRAGGYGVYYHFDYVGGPRSYKWLDTVQVGKVWQQMDLAWKRGARDLWIVNVGDIKPVEYPLDFFLDMAWDPEGMTPETLAAHPREWAAQQFGEEQAVEVSGILGEYARLAAMRKPELLDAGSFPLGDFRSLEREWRALADRVRVQAQALSEDKRAAYFQLVAHRVLAMHNLYRMYVLSAENARYAEAGSAQANLWADRVEQAFAFDAQLTGLYHSQTGGKWNQMMNQPHIGYTSWDDPDENIMPEVRRVKNGDEKRTVLLEPGRALDIIPASEHVRTQSGGKLRWSEVPLLGSQGTALTPLPQGEGPTTAADGVMVEYAFETRARLDHTIEIRLVPTLDTIGDAGLRLGVQIDEGPIEVLTARLEPTNGQRDNPAQEAWVDAVIENRMVVSKSLPDFSRGKHRLRLYRIDDNVVLDSIAFGPAFAFTD